MKNILRDSLGRFKSLKINLLDGQRRGEIVFRRVFLLVVGYALLYLTLGVVIGTGEVEVEANVPDRVEWINGDRVTQKADGVVEVVPASVFESKPEEVEVVQEVQEVVQEVKTDRVREFIKSYGGRIDDHYLALLRSSCSEEALRIVVAISVAESGMGKNTTRATNFFGWHKGGNRSYDPSVEEMAKEICRGVQRSYMSIGRVERVTRVYTGGDRVATWTRNFNWAMEQM